MQSPFSPLPYPTGLLSTVSTPPGSTAAAGFTPATIKLPSSTVLAPTLPPLLQTSTTSTISTTGIWAASYLLFIFATRLTVLGFISTYVKIDEY